MADDKIKDIFKEFDPELSSSFQFMIKLKRNMEAVEIVRQYNASVKRRNKLAVAIAAACGFAMGILTTWLLPFITGWLASLNLTVSLPKVGDMTFDFGYLGWVLVAGVSVMTALSAYEIMLARMSALSNHGIMKHYEK